MTDLLEWAKIAAGPIAGAITGLASSMLGLKKRMEKVEKKVERHGTSLSGHASLFESVEDAMEELRTELREYQQKQTDFANVIRNSSMDFAKDAELVNFMGEQNERWETIQRTLGHIEGYLGLGPHPNIPRPQPRHQNPPPYPTTPQSYPAIPQQNPRKKP